MRATALSWVPGATATRSKANSAPGSGASKPYVSGDDSTIEVAMNIGTYPRVSRGMAWSMSQKVAARSLLRSKRRTARAITAGLQL